MVGLSLGLVVGRGPVLLLLLPLLAAFLLMVTALTYQFQGWLASLMANPRRRRTVIVLVTMAFILIFQLPNLVNIYQPWKNRHEDQGVARVKQQQGQLEQAYAAGQVSAVEYVQRKQELQREFEARLQQSEQQTGQHVEQMFRLINLVLPPGWLPLGAVGMAESDVLPALLGTLGMGLIGTASLWRAYRTTLRLYTGKFTSGKRRAVAAAPPVKPGKKAAVTLLEQDIPGLSEQAAAIALAGFRSLTRAPEAKMMLLTPVILLVVFGGSLLTRSMDPPEAVRPLMLFGAMAIVLLTISQLIANQFGFDRSGFRVYVLCGAPRRDILLGKNLAFAPLALGLGVVAAVVLQAVYPMRLDYILAAFPTFVSMFLLCCLLANCLSLLAPMPIAPGAMKPSNPRGIPLLLHLAFVFLFPMILAPTLLPLGVELLLEKLGVLRGVPLCLILSLLECVAVVFLYRLFVGLQGDWLQGSEQRILDVVTSKAQ
jgi:hypothetical protein